MKYKFTLMLVFTLSISILNGQDVNWWKSFGAGSNETITKVEIDNKGNIVVLGTFDQIFEIDGNPLVIEGGQEFFLAKFDKTGRTLWVRTFTGIGVDQGADIAIDDQNIIYLAAHFDSKVRINDEAIFSEGGVDGLIMQISEAGFNGWIKNFGGVGIQRTLGILVDASDVYAVGDYTEQGRLDNYIVQNEGGADMWIAKIEKTEARVLWAKRFGGSGDDKLTGIVKDFRGDFYVSGAFSDSITIGNQTHRATNGSDVFVAKLTNAAEPIWSKAISSPYESAEGTHIEVDEEANIYITGVFDNSLSIGDASLSSGPDTDGFLLSMNANGGLRWWHSLQTAGPGRLNGLKQWNNRVYVAGTAQNGLLFGQENVTGAQGAFAFMAGFGLDGALKRFGLFDGPGDDEGADLTGEQEKISLIGTFEQSIDLGGEMASSNGGVDLFVANVDATTLLTNVEDIVVHNATLDLRLDQAEKSLTILLPEQLQTHDGHIRIWDTQGRLLSTKKATPQTEFDLSRVSTGVYFVQWSDGRNSVSSSFVLY